MDWEKVTYRVKNYILAGDYNESGLKGFDFDELIHWILYDKKFREKIDIKL